jgi:hypothetical protein
MQEIVEDYRVLEDERRERYLDVALERIEALLRDLAEEVANALILARTSKRGG